MLALTNLCLLEGFRFLRTRFSFVRGRLWSFGVIRVRGRLKILAVIRFLSFLLGCLRFLMVVSPFSGRSERFFFLVIFSPTTTSLRILIGILIFIEGGVKVYLFFIIIELFVSSGDFMKDFFGLWIVKWRRGRELLSGWYFSALAL